MLDTDVDEIERLRRTNRDLAACLALPVLWGGREPPYIVGTLLKMLGSMLQLDLVHAAIFDANGHVVLEECWPQSTASSSWIAQTLEQWPADDETVDQAANLPGVGNVRLSRIPFRSQSGHGRVLAASLRDDFPTEPEMALLRAATNQAGIALNTAHLVHAEQTLVAREQAARQEAEAALSKLQQLEAVMEATLAPRRINDLLRDLLRRTRTALHADTGVIQLLDGDHTSLIPATSDGFKEDLGAPVQVPVGSGIAGRIAASDAGLIVDDVAAVELIRASLREHVRSLVGVPIKLQGCPIGVMHIGSVTPRRFTAAELGFLRMVADRAALAIERVRLDEAEQGARLNAETAAQQFRLALEAGRMGTWQWNIGSGEVKWSPGLEAIHGFPPGSFPGTFDAFQKEIHPDDRVPVLGAIAETVDQRRDHHIEYRIVRPDGSVRWLEARGQLFFDAAGRPDRMVGVCSDVTERKLAEERFRLAIEAAPAAMIMVDSRATIVLVNALAERLFGYARHEIVGQPIERLVPLRFRDGHEEYRTSFFRDANQRPMGAGRDLYALKKGGAEVPVEIGLSPIETTDGLFVLAAVSDITERKRTAAVLEEAVRARDDFLAIASHELRNPVNAVQLELTGILRAFAGGAASLTPESVRDRVAETNIQVGRLTRLIDTLLDVSRITAGAIVLEPVDVDLREIVHTVIDQSHQELEQRQITLRMPEQSIVGHWDRLRLEQIVMNLLSNAIKYGNGKPIEISVEADGEMARLSIADHGIGIDEETQKRLFMRFERAVSGLRYGGFGLGLWISRQLVEAMHGTIAVDSRPGQGSTFAVTVPIRPSATASVQEARSGMQRWLHT